MFKKCMVAAAVVLGGFAPAARADECYTWEKVATYEYVTTYVCKQVPYTKTVCLYDHCGKPYHVEKTFYKTVKVPVTKKAPVVKYVKRYH
jgi:hypothetical protein